MKRTLSRVVTLAAPHQGAFGPAHQVVEVIEPAAWADNDPFILLMDDRIDGKAAAGKHPHAGFETVTYVVQGRMGRESGVGQLSEGDVEWITAGNGIVHGPAEDAPIVGKIRVMQLWVTLPKKDRWTTPDHQVIPAAEALVRHEPGVDVRLFSGTSGGLESPTRNRVPMTVADIRMEPGARLTQDAPPTHNGFFYVLSGRARVGGSELTVGQVGWLDRPGAADAIDIENAGDEPLHLLFYSGERQNTPIVSYGPFIGDTREDIVRSIERYHTGVFKHY